MKTCSKCKIDKDDLSFHKDIKSKTGRRSICNSCVLGHEPHKKPLIEKECRKCFEVKSVNDFYYINKEKFQHSSYCKKCKNKMKNDYDRANPLRTRLKKLNQQIKGFDKISIERYEEMVISQFNKCDICKLGLKSSCVDHDHSTNKVRGLLCSNCNSGIGMLQDNIEILKNAIIYLEKHRVN